MTNKAQHPRTPAPTSATPDRFLDPKDVYAETGNNYRFFLAWRHALMAGYLAVLAAVAVALWAVVENRPGIIPWIFVVAIVVTGVFWALEARNRDLYRACLDAGEQQESTAGIVGSFTKLNAKPTWPTQSNAIDFLFVMVLLASAAALVFSAMRFGLGLETVLRPPAAIGHVLLKASPNTR